MGYISTRTSSSDSSQTMIISSSQFDCHCSTNARTMDADQPHKTHCPFQQLSHPPPTRAVTRSRRLLQRDTKATSSILKEDTESFCSVIFVYLVVHPMLCETFLVFRSGAVRAFFRTFCATAIVILRSCTHHRTFGRSIFIIPSATQ